MDTLKSLGEERQVGAMTIVLQIFGSRLSVASVEQENQGVFLRSRDASHNQRDLWKR